MCSLTWDAKISATEDANDVIELWSNFIRVSLSISIHNTDFLSTLFSTFVYIWREQYIYIYIYRERKTEVDRTIYIYIEREKE